MRLGLLLILGIAAVSAQIDQIDGQRIAAYVKFLSSDLLEGRAPGTRGGQIAEEYLAAQFALAGLTPLGKAGTWFQRVPLVSVAVDGTPRLSFARGGRSVPLRWSDEITGKPYSQSPVTRIDAEAVFAGYGITAPEFNWDNYKNFDVRGKAVVLFTGEPDSEDPQFFGGKALTYYGRWTYKYEEATRRGAVAVLIIHTTPTASYGWNVVQGFGRAEPQAQRQSGEAALDFGGWISAEAAERAFGRKIDDLLAMAQDRSSEPLPLGLRLQGEIRLQLKPIVTSNIVGLVRGRDPELAREAVIFTAHWDHLGVGEPVQGDAIYNGALDNATGTAVLLEMAKAWASLEPRPKRSAVFAAVTAEEAGLLGSQYCAQHPPSPGMKLVANLNVDMLYPYGRNTEIVVNGAERTALWQAVQSLASRFELSILPDPRPEAGSYYRSDHFSFAQAGIPAFSVGMGRSFAGKPAASERVRTFLEQDYHQPGDQWRDDFDFSGIELTARYVFALGLEISSQGVGSSGGRIP